MMVGLMEDSGRFPATQASSSFCRSDVKAESRAGRSSTWLDEVVGRGRDSEAVAHVRGAEVVHFVVEDDAGRP